MIVLYAYIAQSQHQHLIDKYGDLFTDRFKAKILIRPAIFNKQLMEAYLRFMKMI